MADYPPIGHLPHSETTNTLTITVERVGEYNRELCEYIIKMTGKEPLRLYYSSVTGSPDLDLAEVAWEAVDLWRWGHAPDKPNVYRIPPE